MDSLYTETHRWHGFGGMSNNQNVNRVPLEAFHTGRFWSRVLETWHTRDSSARDYYWLQKDPSTIAMLQDALDRDSTNMPRYKIVGDRVTYGIAVGEKGRRWMHADEPLQGGTHSLLVYLNDVPSGAGGRTRFYCGETMTATRPERGKHRANLPGMHQGRSRLRALCLTSS